MKPRRPRARLPLWVRIPIMLFVGIHLLAATALTALRYINPPTTGVQIQRRLEALLTRTDYHKRSAFVPLERISASLQHAVIAAEDGRFYQNYGIDWQQVQIVLEEAAEKGEPSRGASTITQQLVKNLFFTTYRDPVRKALEYTLAPMATLILGKHRVLELYLNIVEWGPGVWGAEAAAQYHYQTRAALLNRDQSARLAACLPAPLRWRPARMDSYSEIIGARMSQLGW
jgi:monofunctional biosynthetic peptidoglycan transglycosylase